MMPRMNCRAILSFPHADNAGMAGESQNRGSRGVDGLGDRRLEKAGDVERLAAPDRALLLDAVGQADGLVVRTYAEVTAEVIDAVRRGGRLKVIGRAGVGLDNIDVKAALAAGIAVVHTPAASTDAVADFVVGLIIAMQRDLVFHSNGMHAGEFASLRAASPNPESCGIRRWASSAWAGSGRRSAGGWHWVSGRG